MKSASGYTFFEAMFAVALLTIVTAGITLPFANGAALQAEGARRTLAAKLASDLLEEIVNSDFNNIIANYDGYSEAEGQVKDSTGLVLNDQIYSSFSRDVTCQNATVANVSLIWVTVIVSYKDAETARLSTLIGE